MRRFFRRRGERHIGAILVSMGIVTPSQLLRALDVKFDRDVLLGEVLVAQDACTRPQLERALTVQRALRGDGPDYSGKAKRLVRDAGHTSDVLEVSLDAVRMTARLLTAREGGE